jgi:CRP/FNR family transcriptional regulator/CRP/FNR family cyclic AMP-dependent transcriptional regulator
VIFHRAGREEAIAFFLARASLFASLSEIELEAVRGACRVRRFKAGEVLFHEGDPGHTLYVLGTGRVKSVMAGPYGAETILAIHGPGDSIGELSLLDDEPRAASAVAMEPTEALALYRDDFLALMDMSPALAWTLVRRLSVMVRRLNRQLRDAALLDSRGRLARILLELAEEHGEATTGGVRIALRLSQQELAQMVGGARSNVSIHLRSFQDRGILTVAREQILIHKPAELRKPVA